MPTVLVVGRPDAPDPTDLIPLLQVLVRRGHRVVLLATEEQRETARRCGVGFEVLPPLPAAPPHGPLTSPVSRMQRLFRSLFIDPLAVHWPTVERVVREERPDLVLSDALCFAACMLAARPSSARPPVVVLGTIPPPHANPRAAPYGMGLHPSEALVNRLRNHLLHLVMRHVLLGPVVPELRRRFQQLTGHEMGRDTYAAAASAEVWAQCEPPRFEYPLAVAADLRLVGPLTAARTALPEAWRYEDRRPIIAVRATRALPLEDLVVPLVRAFEDAPDRLVVITGAARDAVVAALGRPLPEHVHVAEGLPAGQTLPGTEVVVLQGWFVHAQHALQQGVPVVAFGTGAEEVETGARLEWHGCGVRLRTDRPTAEQLRTAVVRVLEQPSHRQAAARIAAQAAGMHAEETIADLVQSLLPAEAPERSALGAVDALRGGVLPVTGLRGDHLAVERDRAGDGA